MNEKSHHELSFSEKRSYLDKVVSIATGRESRLVTRLREQLDLAEDIGSVLRQEVMKLRAERDKWKAKSDEWQRLCVKTTHRLAALQAEWDAQRIIASTRRG